MDLYQQIIFKTRYAKWDQDFKRRENWEETVDRYIGFFQEKFEHNSEIPWERLKNGILNFEAMGSMRALMTAGKALTRDNVAGYNCAAVSVDHPHIFDETMYILMCGTGVGFSVERQFVQKMPIVAEEFHPVDVEITVRDSRIGWATAYRQLISLLYSGQVPTWNMSRVRPAGTVLKTFGGRASGPEPLVQLFEFTVNTFKRSAGRKMTSLECHDIMCKIAEIVICGGVRRSALISLSNVSDDRMATAKAGQWWLEHPQRALSNNSAMYDSKPEILQFMREWQTLFESRSGERGIINRASAKEKYAKNGMRDPDHDFLVNPCAEIWLRPQQFCNLSEVVVRVDDTLETLKEKIELATILGTLQATMSDFRYLRRIWKRNTEEERLLGVSLTGIMDNPALVCNKEILEELKAYTVEMNIKYSAILGITPATAITTVKPSGTVSSLVNSSSGIHPRFAPFYVRTVRQDKKDSVTQFLISQGIPAETDVTNPNSVVFSFPIKSPDNAITTQDMTAMKQLEIWTLFDEHYCHHKPSQTINYTEDEFLEIGAYVYKNFNKMSGISFFPYTDNVYQQAPFQKITEEQYYEMKAKMPEEINWDELAEFEKEDYTTSSHELACQGGSCEI